MGGETENLPDCMFQPPYFLDIELGLSVKLRPHSPLGLEKNQICAWPLLQIEFCSPKYDTLESSPPVLLNVASFGDKVSTEETVSSDLTCSVCQFRPVWGQEELDTIGSHEPVFAPRGSLNALRFCQDGRFVSRSVPLLLTD